MRADDAAHAVSLIRRAMNPAEGRYAERTLEFHFGCRRLGVDDGRFLYVLADDPTLVGIAGLHHSPWGPLENVWLSWFAVDPEFQGKGYGLSLLDQMIRLARKWGFQRLFVETYSTPEFARACAFYAAAGFTLAGTIRSYLPGGGSMLAYYKNLCPLLYEPNPRMDRRLRLRSRIANDHARPRTAAIAMGQPFRP